jgi:predicted AAA+ superfamily ATPase
MEALLTKSINKINRFKPLFERYLYKKINWSNRLISIQGARGTGKTTLLLHYGKELQQTKKSVVYVSMDDLYFLTNDLYGFANTFEQQGGSYLLLDEVHKYPNWSRELKLIYDDFPNLHVVFTSSSILEVYKSESDLSRRSVNYILKELSFREFLGLHKINVPSYSIEEIIENHTQIASEIIEKFKPLKYFQDFQDHGAYPYFLEGIDSYHQKVKNTIDLIIEMDLHAIEDIDYQMLVKLKKLLLLIAQSVPFTINISKMSELVGVSRNTLLIALQLLERARLIHQVNKPNKGIGILTKPEKIYLNNTNLAVTLSPTNNNIGNNRETFFVNQLEKIHSIHLAEKGDFIVNEKYTFEIGGKNKKQVQIQGISDSFIVKDDIEIGIGNIIPLYLFGLLY